MLHEFNIFNGSLLEVTASKQLITTINAHSYNICHKDGDFLSALKSSHVLLPDGVSIVLASRFINGMNIRKIAGYDLFQHEMARINEKCGKCFFLGSSEKTLGLITERASKEYPEMEIHSYSPPFKHAFSDEDNQAMIDAVNQAAPDVLFVGMTAPKQEKWAAEHFSKLDAMHICCIGAVFDFYAGTITRAPQWMITCGLEWFYRLAKEPRRMWRRYLIGNTAFIFRILKLKLMIITGFRHPKDKAITSGKAEVSKNIN